MVNCHLTELINIDGDKRCPKYISPKAIILKVRNGKKYVPYEFTSIDGFDANFETVSEITYVNICNDLVTLRTFLNYFPNENSKSVLDFLIATAHRDEHFEL